MTVPGKEKSTYCVVQTIPTLTLERIPYFQADPDLKTAAQYWTTVFSDPPDFPGEV